MRTAVSGRGGMAGRRRRPDGVSRTITAPAAQTSDSISALPPHHPLALADAAAAASRL